MAKHVYSTLSFLIVMALGGPLFAGAANGGVVRTQVPQTDLPALRSALPPQWSGGSSGENVVRKVESLQKHIASWVLLSDLNDDNALMTSDFRSLRGDHPECIQRILFELLNDELSSVKSAEEKRLILELLLIFENGKWTNLPNAIGTRNGADRNPFYLSFRSTLNSLLKVAKTQEKIDGFLRPVFSCSRSLIFSQLFRWIDLSVAEEILQSRDDPKSLEAKLQQMILSTSFPLGEITVQPSMGLPLGPLLPNVTSRAFFPDPYTRQLSAYFSKDQRGGETAITVPAPPDSLGLRPSLGLWIDPRKVTTEFYRAFWHLIEAAAFPGGTMTPASCAAVGRYVSWANFLGLEVSSDLEVRTHQLADGERLREATRMLAAMAWASLKGDPVFLPCTAALASLQRFWNDQANLETSSLLTMDFHSRLNHSSSPLRKIPTFDYNPLLMAAEGYAGNVVGVVHLFTGGYEKVFFPIGEFKTGGDLPLAGFGFKVFPPKKAKIARPKNLDWEEFLR